MLYGSRVSVSRVRMDLCTLLHARDGHLTWRLSLTERFSFAYDDVLPVSSFIASPERASAPHWPAQRYLTPHTDLRLRRLGAPFPGLRCPSSHSAQDATLQCRPAVVARWPDML